MKNIIITPAMFLVIIAGTYSSRAQRQLSQVWVTDVANNIFFKQQPRASVVSSSPDAVIHINASQRFQQVDGFGFCVTGGSAMLMMQMSNAARAALIKELFGIDSDHIGTSYLRVSMGASDLSDHVFSYDDLPAQQTDTGLVHFNLGPDKKDVIPVLKEILRVNPSIKILASPWSPPVWMKTNNDTRGGSLRPEYYGVYAKYFVKYIRAMAREGISIDAVTIQNEPLHPGNNPSLFMPAPEQTVFVRDHLGPAFGKAHLSTKIIIYDHNADRPEYPLTVLSDEKARKYIDGSAFHLYGGRVEALSKVHDAYPDKNIYFTEQWVGAPGNFSKDISWHIEQLIIGATRNWSRNVIEWNLASDPQYRPHTDSGGCTGCLGAVTINGDSVTRNPAYYIIAHAAKFTRPGSYRVASDMPEHLPNVAFITPAGSHVLIVLNTADTPKTFTVAVDHNVFSHTLNAGSVGSYTW